VTLGATIRVQSASIKDLPHDFVLRTSVRFGSKAKIASYSQTLLRGDVRVYANVNLLSWRGMLPTTTLWQVEEASPEYAVRQFMVVLGRFEEAMASQIIEAIRNMP
jgi:hypothetical protein